MVKEFVGILRERIDKELSKKTTWGRSEIKFIINQILTDILVEMIEKEKQNKK